MTDAISRSAVLEALESEKRRVMAEKGNDWPFTGEILARAVDTARAFIKDIPAIDAVTVVRCGDCKYAIPLEGYAFRRWGNSALNCTECRGDDGFGMAGVSLAYHDGFCDRGVRMDGEAG